MEPQPSPGRLVASHPSLVAWLEGRLLEERRVLECRHAAMCEALLLEMNNTQGESRNPVTPEGSTSANGVDSQEALPLDFNALNVTEGSASLNGVDTREDVAVANSTRDHHQSTALTPPKKKSTPGLDSVVAVLAPERVSDRDVTTTTGSRGSTGKKNLPSKASGIRGANKHAGHTRFQRIILGNVFEAAFGVLILTNSAIMALEVQWIGVVLTRATECLGPISPAQGEDHGPCVQSIKEGGIAGWPNAKEAFIGFEWFFGAIFTLEVILKVSALKRHFFASFWNLFDSVIVGFWLLGNGLIPFPVNPMVLRACRLVRLLRLLRLAKMTSMFDTLVLMISSVQASIAVLVWGVVLLLLCMTISALVLNSFLEEFMDPERSTLTPAVRDQIYDYFGTYTLCMITMFEITLASWVGPCRLLVEHLGQGYAIFFLSYKCVVGFAVLKVITGVFLHETFRCASLDDDLMIQNRRRMRKKFKKKMMNFFDEANMVGGDDGDSADCADEDVSCEEFVAMIADERVNTWLEAMDLRIRDVGAERIFAFLAGPDMELTRDELCSGMARLRGAAQGLDVVTLLEIADPKVRMPKSMDILRLTGDEDEKPSNLRPLTLHSTVSKVHNSPSPAHKTAGLRDPAPEATEMRWATAELLAATADLRFVLERAAASVGLVPPGDVILGRAGTDEAPTQPQEATRSKPVMAPWFRV